MRLKIADLQPGQNYSVQVRAVNDGLSSEWSEKFDFTSDVNGTAPVAPTSVTWVVSEDAFVATFAPVATDTSGAAAIVVAYELEFTATGITKVITIPQKTGSNIVYTLSFEQNVALFGTPKPSVDFRVRSVNNKGVKSAWTSTINAANPTPGTPVAPADGVVAKGGPDTVTLSWLPPADKDLAGYNVYTGASAGFTPGAGNKIYSGLGNGFIYNTTTYSMQYFKIFAVDKFLQESSGHLAGNAQPTSPFGSDTTAPAVPTSLAATLTNNPNGIGATAAVTWNQAVPAQNDLSGFYIRYKRPADSNWSQVNIAATGAFVSGTSYATSIPLNYAYTAYDFQIKSYDFTGNESAWSSTVSASAGTNANPSNVTGLVSTPGRDAIRYDWTAVADADVNQYEITFSTSPTFASGNTTFRAGGTTMTVSGLTPSTTYYARIKAVDTAGLLSSSWSSTDTETTLSASSTVTAGDLQDGTFVNDFVLGPSSSLIINGGYIKSNTYTGVTQASNPSGVGFYLGNDGIRVDNGIISASALVAGTISGTNTITLSGANAKIVGGSWELSGSGLSIPDGGVTAQKITLQNSANILKPEHADFEFNMASVASFVTASNATAFIETNAGAVKFNAQSLRVSANGSGWLWLGLGNTDYNQFPVNPSTTYIISFYAMVPTGLSAQSIVPTIRHTTTSPTSYADAAGASQAVPANSTWARYTTTVTVGATTTGTAALWFSFNNAGTIYFDGIQVEEKVSFSTTASAWKPPGITKIDGGQIATGAIRSTYNSNIETTPGSGVYEPVWSIPLNGAATFSAMRVLGNTVIGNGVTDAVSVLQSSNYRPGEAGWRLNATGEVEFKKVTADGFSGSIVARNTDSLSPGLGSTVTLSGDGFFVKGSDAKGNPEYITFPTSGAPNIISGTLQAETLTVSGYLNPDTNELQGASFRGISHFELGSEVMLDNAVGTPLAAPSVTESVQKITYSGSGPTSNMLLMTYDGGKIYRVEVYFVALSSVVKLHTYSSAGVWESSTFIPKPTAPAGGSMSEAEPAGLTKLGSSWYFLWQYTGVSQNVLSKHDGTTLAVQSRVDVNRTNNSSSWAVGHDGTDILIGHWNPFVTNGANRVPYVVHHNASTLATTGTIITLDTYPSATNSIQTGGGFASIMAGEFDYGAGNKTYIAAFNYGQEPPNSILYAYNSTGVRQTAREWPLEKPSDLVDGMAYDGTTHNTAGGYFWQISYMNYNTYKYTPSMWTGSESMGWGFSYSWYKNVGRTATVTTTNLSPNLSAAVGTFLPTDVGADVTGSNIPAGTKINSVGVNGDTAVMSANASSGTSITMTFSYETTLAPNATLTVRKRRRYSITGVTGPAGTVVRPYLGRGTTGWATPTVSQMCLQGTLAGGIISYTTDTPNFAGAAPKVPGTFAPGIPGKIYTQQTYNYTVTPVTTVGSPVASATITGTGNVPVFGQHMVGALVSGTGIPAGTRILSVATDRITAVMSNTATANNGSLTLTLTQPSIEMKGDGFLNVERLYARQTILTSTQDVNANAGNMPPLRVGDINGDHLRIDGNEIQAMDDDDTVGGILINVAGGTIKLGESSSTIRKIRFGTTTDTASANGDLTIPHGMGATPDHIIVNGRGQEGTANLYMPWDANSTRFLVRVRVSSTGVPIGSGTSRTVDWIAIQT